MVESKCRSQQQFFYYFVALIILLDTNLSMWLCVNKSYVIFPSRSLVLRFNKKKIKKKFVQQTQETLTKCESEKGRNKNSKTEKQKNKREMRVKITFIVQFAAMWSQCYAVLLLLWICCIFFLFLILFHSFHSFSFLPSWRKNGRMRAFTRCHRMIYD